MLGFGVAVTVEFKHDCMQARIFVNVVMHIGAYYLLYTYYLFTYCYKRMRLLMFVC